MAGEIATRGQPAPVQAGRRWPIERTHAWGNQYGKLRWCTERRRLVVEFWLAMAGAAIVCGRLVRRAWTCYRWDTRPAARDHLLAQALARRCSRWVIDLASARPVTGVLARPRADLAPTPGPTRVIPDGAQPSPECMLCPGSRRPLQGRQVNQFHDHGRVRQHAAMTGSRRQAVAAVAPARWRPSGWAGYAAAGWALVFAVRGVYWTLGGTVGLGTLSPGIQQAAVARDRALLAARDVAILKAVGMSPRQLLAMVMTASAVLGVIGGLVALPLGVRAYHGLMTQLAQQVGNRPPPFAFSVLHPATLYPLGVMGFAVALAGAVFPARRAARSRAAAILRSE